MSREAMRVALEALAEIHPGNMTPMAEIAWNKAIVALREALEAEPKQEPVAWMYDWTPGDGEVASNWVSQDYDEAHSPTMGCHNIRPLYLHPAPAQKPLTDSEITEMADQKDIWQFARALEAAHGIGETK